MRSVGWKGRSLAALVAMVIEHSQRCNTNLKSSQPHHPGVDFAQFVACPLQ
jgi:hypothetical protein